MQSYRWREDWYVPFHAEAQQVPDIKKALTSGPSSNIWMLTPSIYSGAVFSCGKYQLPYFNLGGSEGQRQSSFTSGGGDDHRQVHLIKWKAR